MSIASPIALLESTSASAVIPDPASGSVPLAWLRGLFLLLLPLSLAPLSRLLLMTDSGFCLINGPKELTSDVIPAANKSAGGTPLQVLRLRQWLGILQEVRFLCIHSIHKDLLSTSVCGGVPGRALKSFLTLGSVSFLPQDMV